MSCDVKEASCCCELEAEHAGPHVCECGGSWSKDENGFRIHRLPGLFGSEEFAAVVRGQGDSYFGEER